MVKFSIFVLWISSVQECFLRSDVPVFIVSFRTQEIHVYRDIKTDEIKAGVEDRIQQVLSN